MIRILLVVSLCSSVAFVGIKSAAKTAEVGMQTRVGERLARGAKSFLAVLAIAAFAGSGWALKNQEVKAQRIYLDRELRSLAGGEDHVLGIEKDTAENYNDYRQRGIPIHLTTSNGVLVHYINPIHPTFYNGMLVHYKKLGKSYIGQVGLFDAKEREVALIRNHIDPKATRYRPRITVVDASVIDVITIEGVLVEAFAAEDWVVPSLAPLPKVDTTLDGRTIITETNHYIRLHTGREVFFTKDEADSLKAQSLYGYQLSELGDVVWGEERLVFSDGMHVIKLTKTGIEVENDDPNHVEVDWFDLEHHTFVIVNGSNFTRYFRQIKNNKDNISIVFVWEDKVQEKNKQQEWVKRYTLRAK